MMQWGKDMGFDWHTRCSHSFYMGNREEKKRGTRNGETEEIRREGKGVQYMKQRGGIQKVD